MGLNDEAEKTAYARHLLEEAPVFTTAWYAALEHLGMELTAQQHAVIQIAAQNGIQITPELAKQIVEGVTESFDDIVIVREGINPDIWDSQHLGAADFIRATMRKKVWAQVDRRGWLPTGPIKETVTHSDTPWGHVVLEMRVNVRKAA